jgi:hypothetical protein
LTVKRGSPNVARFEASVPDAYRTTALPVHRISPAHAGATTTRNAKPNQRVRNSDGRLGLNNIRLNIETLALRNMGGEALMGLVERRWRVSPVQT